MGGTHERMAEARKTRPVSWLRAALKDFGKFPVEAQTICLSALTIAAEGGRADIAKPLQGFGSGVMEIALPFAGDAYRVVYAVQLGDDLEFMPSGRNRRKASRRQNARGIW